VFQTLMFCKNPQSPMSNFNPFTLIWKKSDFAFFFLFIPAVLTLIFLLPVDLKGNLILHTSNPSVLSMFFSNYVHTANIHFLGNFLLYFVVMFLLFNIETDKKRFYRIGFLIFVVLPFVSSWAFMYYIDISGPTQGFSALLAAFFGYMICSAYRYIKVKYDSSLKIIFLWMLLMLNVSLVMVNLNVKYPFDILIVGFTLLLIVLNVKAIVGLLRQIIANYRLQRTTFETFYVASVSAFCVVSLFVLPSLVPDVIIVDGHMINIFSHYIGWVFGVLVGIGLK